MLLLKNYSAFNIGIKWSADTSLCFFHINFNLLRRAYDGWAFVWEVCMDMNEPWYVDRVSLGIYCLKWHLTGWVSFRDLVKQGWENARSMFMPAPALSTPEVTASSFIFRGDALKLVNRFGLALLCLERKFTHLHKQLYNSRSLKGDGTINQSTLTFHQQQSQNIHLLGPNKVKSLLNYA